MAENWTLPAGDTTYLCDGRTITLDEILDGIAPEFIPKTAEDFDWLMFCMGEGVETPLEEQVAEYRRSQFVAV